MFNLIKNEIFKILHKKSTYIVLIITALFITLVSYIFSDSTNFNSFMYTQSYEDNNNLNEVDNKINKEMIELTKKYDMNNWQCYVLDDMYNVISTYYYGEEDGISAYKEAYEALSNDNWKYFVNRKLKEEKENLQGIEESLKYATNSKEKEELEQSKYGLKVEIEMLEYRLKEDINYGNDYLNNAIDIISYLASSVYKYETTTNDKTKQELESDVQNYYENRYILENKEDINNTSDLRYIMTNFYSEYFFLILVFGVMIAGAIVSDEYNKGTIKSLLITPYKRSSILLAKFVTVIISVIVFIIIAYLMQIVIGGLFLGFGSLANNVVRYNLETSSLEVMSLFKYVLIYTLATIPKLILLITLAFAISVIIGNTALAIVVSFGGIIGSEIINLFATEDKYKFLKYFVTTNWDFNYYLFGGTSPYNTSLIHAIVICIIYFLIMIITTFIVFKKKNIKNI